MAYRRLRVHDIRHRSRGFRSFLEEGDAAVWGEFARGAFGLGVRRDWVAVWELDINSRVFEKHKTGFSVWFRLRLFRLF